MKTNRTLLLGLGALVCTASAACSSTKSTELETSSIRALMHVYLYENDMPPAATSSTTTEPGHGSYLATDLYKNDSYLEVVSLSGGDTLTASTNVTASIPLPGGDIPGIYTSGYMDLSNITSASFVFTRASKTSAPNNKVTIPAAMAITAPVQDAQVSLAGGKVTVTWSNPIQGGKVRVWAKICKTATASATNTDDRVADTGSYDVTVEALGGMPSAPTCYLLTVTRVAEGTVDPAWHSGSLLWAQRITYLTFTGTP